ncbi:AAA family ATPase [Paucidesulfovibrio longus]|uniref:AAA family ATPase n=1 Tax=Paucidesulfovibrio longus TaxID=889 RepID=UPI0003B77AA0|nr:AAA family ATPase [Paucidesulfovibrio longus]
MKISIRDFAPIREADIALDGLTVIAGDNDTGKSTVGKLVYAFLEAAKRQRQGERSLSYEFPNSYWNALGLDCRPGHFNVLDEHGIQLFKVEFLKDSTGARNAFLMNGPAPQSTLKFKDVLFLETPLIWQLFDTFQGIASETAKAQARNEQYPIKFPYTYFDAYSRLNGSVKPLEGDAKGLLLSIEKTVNGKIVFENSSPRFQRGDVSIPMPSVATGIQAFGFIQRILELGLARPGFLLILDEPEVHMHPKWQLEYAKLLVSMVDELGLNVLMTTHSPVFVEAMEFVGKKKLGEKCHFYLSERTADGPVVMRDVTDDPEPIYKQLALPLMQLSLHQGDA